MATASSPILQRVYYNHYKASDFASGFGNDWSADAIPISVFSAGAHQFVQGRYSGTGTINGFLDVTDAGFDEVEHGNITTTDGEQWILRCYRSTTQAHRMAFETREHDAGDSRIADTAGVAMINWNGQSQEAAVHGQILSVGEQVISATGGTTGINVGTTATTDTMVVTVRVIAVDTFTSATVTIEESSDDGSADAYAKITGWTLTEQDPSTVVDIGTPDEVTFTGLGAAKFTVAKVTEAWKRINVTALTGTSFTVIATIGNAT